MESENKIAMMQIKRTAKDIRSYKEDYFYTKIFENYVLTLNKCASQLNLAEFKFEEFHYSASKKTINERGYQSLIHYVDTLEEELFQNDANYPDTNQSPFKVDAKKIFIVHGRDMNTLNQTELLLNRAGLEPIVLNRQTNGGLTLIEKFEKYANVSYAEVLLTPDDVGAYYEEDVYPDLKARARQNVLFELGFFYGKLGRSNVSCLIKNNVEKPSDIDGIAYIPFDKSVDEVEIQLLRELRTADIKVKSPW